jgi:hypothetical protein
MDILGRDADIVLLICIRKEKSGMRWKMNDDLNPQLRKGRCTVQIVNLDTCNRPHLESRGSIQGVKATKY